VVEGKRVVRVAVRLAETSWSVDILAQNQGARSTAQPAKIAKQQSTYIPNNNFITDGNYYVVVRS
jgi:hypothetical protein